MDQGNKVSISIRLQCCQNRDLPQALGRTSHSAGLFSFMQICPWSHFNQSENRFILLWPTCPTTLSLKVLCDIYDNARSQTPPSRVGSGYKTACSSRGKGYKPLGRGNWHWKYSSVVCQYWQRTSLWLFPDLNYQPYRQHSLALGLSHIDWHGIHHVYTVRTLASRPYWPM